ncbi:DUF1835 domain-containing protein [Halobacillus sp. Nhm2S1]|uniref:DUF1835 domain-containing protein n=1 Tax=Halobacillus sp. Nhm2S1 TaxID=2866716 RepID=UPI001C735021|nr:DUF1835 domain-containing protein [Halobacillus sp. Nhm2S1]MBX0356693.1 DUF1835 domain-containing protein [Halobacillus sp. Nhm2S1]
MERSMKRKLELLKEDEMRTILLHQWTLFSYVEMGKISEKEWFDRIKEMNERTERECDDRLTPFQGEEGNDVEHVHIVFSESTKGSLQLALNQKESREEVIALSPMFSIGPIQDLDKMEGIEKRKEWLFYHLVIDDEEWMHMGEDSLKTIEDLRSIPTGVPITIWAGTNAHEQTGLRFVMHLLKNKPNEIDVVQVTDVLDFPLHTGELSPDRFAVLLERSFRFPVSGQIKKSYQDEWHALSEENANLRVWEDGIQSKSEDYFDAALIQSLKRLQGESGDYIKAARLIGEVLGHSSQVVGDSFFEYRVRELVLQREFLIRGVPRGMRYYEVKGNTGQVI